MNKSQKFHLAECDECLEDIPHATLEKHCPECSQVFHKIRCFGEHFKREHGED